MSTPSASPSALPAAAATPRYSRKKEAIVSAATGILNRHGVRGMTLADVAASVGLITTSVTYYFRKKEDLAVACFLQAIARYETLIAEALTGQTPQDCLRRLLDAYLALNAEIRHGEEPPLAVFSDIRALKEPHFSVVNEAYVALFRKVRRLFYAPELSWMDRRMATARAHLLLEQLYWSVTWLSRLDVEDYPRVRDRMVDIFLNGIALPGAPWQPPLFALNDKTEDSARGTFLTSATRLINQHGYRGASVEKIAGELNLTKGSFYHHNETKDDVVVACFARNFSILRQAQMQALRDDSSYWRRLSGVAATLVHYQLSGRGPLLRSTALSALPETIRHDMMERANRITMRFAAMISDGVAEGSLRAVDPFIASQMLNATLNAASALAVKIPDVLESEAPMLYAQPMLMGIFTRP